MKAVILAGGFGSRLSEETELRPKPMIEIGGMPILWHIMKIYSSYEINDFIICLGYKGYIIKEYFANYFLHTSDVTFDIANNKMSVHQQYSEPWHVTLVDTGTNSMTGGRLKHIQPYLGNEDFCFTYGDGVSNINIRDVIAFHNKEGRLATLTAVNPPGRFGALDIKQRRITRFKEKPQGDNELVNGGFFVLSPKVINYIDNSQTIWEQEPMETLAKQGELSAFIHRDFWQPMDTLRDKKYLEELWLRNNAPWKTW